MNALSQITLVNAGCAAILALAVTLAGRYVKRPALLHALWILVLLQLFMPPVFEVDLLPGPAPWEPAEPVKQASVVPASALASPLVGEVRAAGLTTQAPPTLADAETVLPKNTARPRIDEIATTIWLSGTLWVLGLSVVRTSRFRRLLRAAGSTDAALERRLASLARRMGVRKPGLRLVHASVSPLIHPGWSGAELVFPAGLLIRLNSGEQEAILAHELAHVARRDHWVRLLELIAVSLFWWHPASWWARSRLRLAEERCCDQVVMHTLPRRRSSYARGLLKTVEFLAETKARVPALASGVGEVHDLKERLTMILKERPPKSMSRLQRACLVLCAASVLLIFPTWSDRDLQASPPEGPAIEKTDEASLDQTEREYFNQRLELEQQVLELEYALREIRARQADLERLWREQMSSSELEELHQAEAVAARDRAVELYERARELSRQAALEDRLRDRERDQQRGLAPAEYALRRTMLELERAVEQGDQDKATGLRLEVAELERHLQDSIEARELELQRMQEELDHERSGRGALVR